MKEFYDISFKTLCKKISILDSEKFIFIKTNNISTTALNIIENCMKQDISVAIFSCGISAKNLMIKLLSIYTKIPLRNIKVGNLNDNEWSKFNDSIEFFSKSKLFINDDKWFNIDILRKKIKELKRENPSQKFVFVILNSSEKHGA